MFQIYANLLADIQGRHAMFFIRLSGRQKT